MTTKTCCAFQKVLGVVNTQGGECTLRLMCTGKITCGCSGEWEDMLAFLGRSLTPEEAYFRYFNAGQITDKERSNRDKYWQVIGAFIGGDLAGLCYIGVNRVRLRSKGQHAALNDTTTVDLAYVVFKKFRGLGLAEYLTAYATTLCREHFVGTSIEIEALRENQKMVKAMRRMGNIYYVEDEARVRIKLREVSLLDVLSDCVATALGVWHSYATLPWRRASHACTQYAKLRAA